jgi:hypothetical protein
MKYTECPHCGITWEGKEIHLGLYLNGNYTMEEAVEAAAYYGWTLENKQRFSINVVGVETSDYDGVSYWHCLECDAMIDRFTAEITAKGVEEVEEKPCGGFRKRFRDIKAWTRNHPVLTVMAQVFFWAFIILYWRYVLWPVLLSV